MKNKFSMAAAAAVISLSSPVHAGELYDFEGPAVSQHRHVPSPTSVTPAANAVSVEMGTSSGDAGMKPSRQHHADHAEHPRAKGHTAREHKRYMAEEREARKAERAAKAREKRMAKAYKKAMKQRQKMEAAAAASPASEKRVWRIELDNPKPIR